MVLIHWIFLLSLSILWGASFYFTEKAFSFFSVEQIVFLRVFIAAIFIGLVVWIKKVSFKINIKLISVFVLLGLLNNVIPFLGFTYAQESITASLASLCNATTPIFTALLAHFFTKDEKLNLKTIVGIGLGFVGMFILLSPNRSFSFEYGVIIALFSAFSFAVAGILGKLLKEYNPLVSAFGMLSASTVSMILFFPQEIVQIQVNSLMELQDIVLLAVFSTAIAYMIYFRLLFKIGVVKLLLVTYLVPLSASFLGVFFLDEIITRSMIIGSFFIFISLWMVNHERTL